MECLSYCIANHLDLSGIDHFFKANPTLYISNRSRDVVKLNQPLYPDHLVFVFKNGTIVCWGMKRHLVSQLLTYLRPFADKPILANIHDEFSYRIGDRTTIQPHDYFDVDCLMLDKEADGYELRLSLSYGFSQSVKLQYFENLIENLAEKYTPLIKTVSTSGDIPISRKQIQQASGEILGTKTDLNLISNFMYHPKYFWQHPTLEEYFIMLERYLHIQRRVTAINHRLDTIDEIFAMFNRYLENRHAHTLEIIIIVLIAIEIVIGVLKFHF
ncbi:MAG: RMD1 family protein [Gammaproteobacteria bacterium]|nr:RMD1 family protein [Gammaproteobacteria bacterium]